MRFEKKLKMKSEQNKMMALDGLGYDTMIEHQIQNQLIIGGKVQPVYKAIFQSYSNRGETLTHLRRLISLPFGLGMEGLLILHAA